MFIIQEIQTGVGTAITPAIVKTDVAEAESAFLLACASACNSTVPIHTVLCMDESGNHVFMSPRTWKHPKE